MRTRMNRAALVMLLAVVAASQASADDAALRVPPRIVPTDGAVNPSTGLYLYDPSGNIAAIGASSYVYDPMSRVVTAAVDRFGNVQSQTYTYDVYGNRTSDGVTSYSASSSTNRLTSVGAQYDAAGNLTAWQPPHSTTPRRNNYDALNTLMVEKVTVVGGEEYVAHSYTAADERYWSFQGGASGVGISRYTLRDLAGRVLREFSEPAPDDWSVRDYVYRDGLLLASHDTRTGDEHHYSLDHLGTPRVVTNEDAEKVAEHTYFPFGAEYTDGGPSDGRLHFTGHEQRDADLLGENRGELDYMHARYYSADLARFLSTDPKNSTVPNSPQSLNKYSYSMNNGLKFIDPNGKEWFAVLQADRTTGVLTHEALVDINMKTGEFGLTYEHPRYENEYIGPYVGSYGEKRNYDAVKFKFLGYDFDPEKHADPNPNELYLDGTLQCTMYSEIKQGGKASGGMWNWLLVATGAIQKQDVLLHPILGDRKKDPKYQSRPTIPLQAFPSGLGDPHAFTGALVDGVWMGFAPPLLYQ